MRGHFPSSHALFARGGEGLGGGGLSAFSSGRELAEAPPPPAPSPPLRGGRGGTHVAALRRAACLNRHVRPRPGQDDQLPSLRGALATKQSILAFFLVARWIASLALAMTV